MNLSANNQFPGGDWDREGDGCGCVASDPTECLRRRYDFDLRETSTSVGPKCMCSCHWSDEEQST